MWCAWTACLPAVRTQEKPDSVVTLLVTTILNFYFLFLRLDGESAVKPRACFKAEHPVELAFTDHLIHRRLIMFAANLGQNQLGGITIVEPAEVGLDHKQFPGFVECHQAYRAGESLAGVGGRK